MARTLRLTREEYDTIQAQRRLYDVPVTRKAKPDPPPAQSEATVQRECMRVLDEHPKVAFWWRQNTGGTFDRTGRFVKFAFKGCADLLGCTIAGRFLAVECKATGKLATPDQAGFLANVNAAGGLGVCVDSAAILRFELRDL